MLDDNNKPQVRALEVMQPSTVTQTRQSFGDENFSKIGRQFLKNFLFKKHVAMWPQVT